MIRHAGILRASVMSPAQGLGKNRSHQIMCVGQLCNVHRFSTAAPLLSSRTSSQCLCYSTISRRVSSNRGPILRHISAYTNVIARSLSNSAKPDPPPPNTLIQSIHDELKFLFDSIRQLTLNDISLWLLRTSALIGTVHMTTEYGFRTFTCEGPSMEPTIIDGSFTLVLVERWSHRLFGLEDDYDVDSEMYESESCGESIKTSTEQNIFDEWVALFRGIWKQHFASGLQRGDVIILNHPNREGTICKRIIGMPGDIVVRTDGGSQESNNRVAIPLGHFWVEGDNSLQSLDSRDYGAIPASLTIGKVICRLWPLRDYAWVGIDANGTHQWKRVGGRIGRGGRPIHADEKLFIGSHVLGKQR